MLKDNVFFGFTYIRNSTPKKPYGDVREHLTIEIKALPYCNNEDCVRIIAGLIYGYQFSDEANIAEDRITDITNLKDKTWRVTIFKPYKD